ncbi:hypothetical protein, partial [Limnohabitans sp.]|uniref:hypothetical protein n=1 Tax=Limnohabitans sp. TaxID=1907725 RepID=UPI00333EB49D
MYLLKKGPVGLLAASVVAAGGRLREGFLLDVPDEPTIDLLRDPIQWLRSCIMRIGRQSSLRRLANKRSSFRHEGGIDWRASTAVRAAISPEQQQDLLCIQGGGLWTAHTLKAAGLLEDDVCPWCAQDVEDLGHLWWKCPAFRDVREQALRGQSVDYTMLPPCLALHGLVPEMAADVTKAFWVTEEDAPALGVWAGAQDWQGHVPRWATEDAGLTWADVRGWTMRRLLAQLAGPFPHYAPEAPARVPGRAPDDINVYVDGGLRHGPHSPAALGSWGLFTRAELSGEDTALLERSGWIDRFGDRISLWGQLDGHPISSTRSEGWGLIAAHMLPIPVHVGVDNSGADSNANKILSGEFNLARRPWGMRPDGDVWGLLHSLIVQRGVGATRVTKVRGHATSAMVDSGAVRRQDMMGNYAAAATVERGYRSYRPSRLALAALFEERHKLYLAFSTCIQRLM